MGLLDNPATREETAAPNDPVNSALLNEIQDAIIAIRNGTATLYADETIVIPWRAASTEVPHTADTPQTSTGWDLGGNISPMVYPVSAFVPVGKKIKSWSLEIHKGSSAAETIRGELFKVTVSCGPGYAEATVGAQQNNAVNAPGLTSIGQAGLTQLVAAGESYILRAQSMGGAVNDFLGDLTITFGV